MLDASILLLSEQLARQEVLENIGDIASSGDPSEVTIAALVSRWPGLVGWVHHINVKQILSANMYM